MNKPPMKLILVRHAESERNKALEGSLFMNDPALMESVGRIPDHKINLTEEGKRQAAETSKYLKEAVGIPDMVFHSGYQRTKQTAEGIMAAYAGHHDEIIIKENLAIREREGGYTHILLEEDKLKYFPYLQDYWDVVGGLFARPVGGESLMDVAENRLKPFLNFLYKEYSGKTVLLVTHGRVIQCMRFVLDEMTWEEMENFLDNKKENIPANCGVTVYSYDEAAGKLKLDMWNKVFWK